MLTGATLAKASALGFRTIVVYGSRGDAGETNADLGGQSLGERRMAEAEAACAQLGVDRVEWLPYDDSGMAGTDTTSNPNAFSNADAEAVAALIEARLADEQRIAAVVGYDANGTYGHPDHKQVHHVGHALGRLRPQLWVMEATYNREYLAGLPESDGELDPAFAAAEADLTHFVEGEEWFQAKMSALANHVSQIPDDWDSENPDVDGFRTRFGTEWFITTPGPGAADFGSLGSLLEDKADWATPVTEG